MESDQNKNHGKASIGGRSKRNHQRMQERANQKARAQAQAQAQAESSSHAAKELTFQEMLGIVDTIVRDWSAEQGQITGHVMDQREKDICWAICFARLVQAINNIGLPSDQHLEISIDELIDKIMPEATVEFCLANLKTALNKIDVEGILKLPTTSRKPQKASSKGKRVSQPLELYEDVDSSFIRAKVDRAPVALILEPTTEFYDVGQAGVYCLPKKKGVDTISTLHSLLIIGYGVSKKGELFFIGQNSYGEGWGCKGYAIIIISHKCDIIALNE